MSEAVFEGHVVRPMGGTTLNDNMAMVRTAYEAHARGDLGTMLGFVDPDLEWTYLDPPGGAQPQVCHGRAELEIALANWAEHGLRAEIEEIDGNVDHVMVGIRTPGLDEHRGREGDDRSDAVLTLREGRIVGLRDFGIARRHGRSPGSAEAKSTRVDELVGVNLG